MLEHTNGLTDSLEAICLSKVAMLVAILRDAIGIAEPLLKGVPAVRFVNLEDHDIIQ